MSIWAEQESEARQRGTLLDHADHVPMDLAVRILGPTMALQSVPSNGDQKPGHENSCRKGVVCQAKRLAAEADMKEVWHRRKGAVLIISRVFYPQGEGIRPGEKGSASQTDQLVHDCLSKRCSIADLNTFLVRKPVHKSPIPRMCLIVHPRRYHC